MAEFVTEEWEARAAEYDAGVVGSRRLMTWEVGLITASLEALRELAAAQPHDAGFAPFLRRAQAAGIPVEVVSDGFGLFIPAALEALGVGDVPVVSANTSLAPGEPPRIAFPNGHPGCFVCGTRKRARVRAHQAAGHARRLHRRRGVGSIRRGLRRRCPRQARRPPAVLGERLAIPALDGVRRDRRLAGRRHRSLAD
jgi:hypothetical protein